LDRCQEVANVQLDLTVILLGLALFPLTYWLVVLGCVWRLRDPRSAAPRYAPPVTVLKPVRSDDGQLYENLRSFCEQDYPAYEVLVGVRNADDPAVAVVERLAQDLPHLDLTCVVTGAPIGSNRKISTLEALSRRARYDTLVVADADMRVTPDYLRAVVAPLGDPSVGLVTCRYRGLASGGLASTLGAMFINEWFFPGALVGARFGPLRNAFGATFVLHRDVLASLGGFGVLADHLADDYLIGAMVSRRGLRVVLAPYLVTNIVVEQNLRSLLLHELRWARTFRTVRPFAYACSGASHSIPMALLLLLAAGPTRTALTVLALNVLARFGGRVALYRRLGIPLRWWTTWLVPFRDLLSFALWALSFLGREVQWGGERFRVDAGGRLHPVLASGKTASPRGAEQTTGSL
jgi:ceramide glucosyltransferase